MNEYHIVWMIGKTDEGVDMSTGKTYQALNMEVALLAFHQEHPEVNDPLYILKKNQ